MDTKRRRPAGRAWLTVGLLSLAAAGPASRPADPLPPAAVLRLGDDRLATALRVDDGALSPDGGRFATADGVVRVWDCSTGRPAWAGSVKDGGVERVTYLGPAELAALAWTGVPMVRVYDAATGRLDRSFRAQGELFPPDAIAASPDGSRLAVVGSRLALYNARTTRLVADLGPAHPAGRGVRRTAAATVQFSGDGRLLHLVSADGRTATFDADTGLPTADARPFPASAGASWSADGRTVAAAGASLRLFDAATGNPIAWPPPPAAATAPTSRPTTTMTTAAVTRPFPFGRRGPFAAGGLRSLTRFAFAPSGGRLAIALTGTRSAVELWDTTVRPPAGPRPIPVDVGTAFGLAWSADGNRLAVWGGTGRPELLDVATGLPLFPPPPHDGALRGLAVAADGRSVVLDGADGTVDRWDLTTGARLAVRTGVGPAAGGSIAFAGDGLVIGSTLGFLARLDGTTLAPTPLPAAPVDASRWRETTPTFSPDGRMAVRRTGKSDAQAWVVATGQPLWQSPDLSAATVGAVALSAEGATAAVATNRVLHLFRVSDGRHTVLGGVPLVAATVLRFSPDGRLLFAGGLSGFGLWDVADAVPAPADVAGGGPAVFGGPLPDLPGPRVQRHVDGCSDGDVNDDGTLLAVTAFDGGPVGVVPPDGAGAIVYEVATGRPVATVRGHVGRVDVVRFVPGRPLLVTAAEDGNALVWDLRRAVRARPIDPARTEPQLWADVSDPDPAVAYRAGLALLDRGRLPTLSAAPPAPPPSPAATYRRLVGELSSDDLPTRERAHRALEAAGPAAAGEVRRALDAHPGGEAEARLTDLARLAPAAGPSAPDAPRPVPIDICRQRIGQLLRWSADPAHSP